MQLLVAMLTSLAGTISVIQRVEQGIHNKRLVCVTTQYCPYITIVVACYLCSFWDPSHINDSAAVSVYVVQGAASAIQTWQAALCPPVLLRQTSPARELGACHRPMGQ